MTLRIDSLSDMPPFVEIAMRRLLSALWPVLVGLCSVNVTSTARAEMLLAEITYTTLEPVVAPASFGFGAGNGRLGSDRFHNWIESIPTLPHRSYANDDTIAAMDRILTTNTGLNSVSFGLTNGPYELLGPELQIAYLDRAFMGDYADYGVTAIRHAPPIRDVPYALQWYALTAIERNATPTIQSIRIYGFPDPPPIIPEPSTWLLTALGGLLHISMCYSCSACGRHRRACRRP
jgi:hypothetical protein